MFGEELDARIRVVDISSRTLDLAKQFDFPVALESDLPAEMESATLDEALTKSVDTKADIVILIDIAAARADRDIGAYRPVASEQQVGSRSVPNPAYSAAQNKVTHKQMELQSARMRKMSADSEYCQGFGCLVKISSQLIALKAVREAEEAMTQAMSSLQSTPMMVDEPVYAAYQIRFAEVSARKTAVVNYYVIDRRAKRMFKDTFDAVERQEFDVPYGISAADRYKAKHLDGANLEQDVIDFEKEPMTVAVSDLMEQFFANKATTKPVPSLKALRTAILKDKNAILARFEADRVKEVRHTAFDHLAESVVAVFNPSGGIGTGFYVTDELIITNQHVVGDASFVEIKLRNGQESFGKVLAKDVRRDLALVKVQARGAPVGFFAGDALPIGATAVAIGHPRNLQFSISRGVISAVREMHPLAVGGKKVWHVQTDAAINPGNSGGPLFIEGEVVGVNTYKSARKGDSGLSFAVLYKEVITFLKAHDVKFRVGTTSASVKSKGAS